MPRVRVASLPPELERVMKLGISRPMASVLIALAESGGSASTGALVERTGMITPTALTALKALEEAGYVAADVPLRDRRQGVRLTWTIDSRNLRGDLQVLAQAWTPPTRA